MITQDSRLFCRLDGLTATAREQQRMLAMAEFSLHEIESLPVFEEAIQTVAHTLEVPICILGIMERDRQRFKAAVGLSRLGLMNELATSRQLPRTESFCTHVVDSQQALVVNDVLTYPIFANSILAHQYGIRSYLGVPLMLSTGYCIGTLAVMDTEAHTFTQRDLEFLQLTARWSMSEFERQHTMKKTEPVSAISPETPAVGQVSTTQQLKVEVLSQLTQELRTPLTSVMGMASVLTHEIYGPLTGKQKEYLGIIHNSGQYLLSLVNEILELSDLQSADQTLNLASLDIEMLCQQAINTLDHASRRREQTIRLTIEPGPRIWLLDKDKVRQMLYHLVFSAIQAATPSSTVRLHVSRKAATLNIAVWVSHPWLGEGLPYAELCPSPSLISVGSGMVDADWLASSSDWEPTDMPSQAQVYAHPETITAPSSKRPRKNLGLLLSQHLAQQHGGTITIQGTDESGYRYIISLPQMAEIEESA